MKYYLCLLSLLLIGKNLQAAMPEEPAPIFYSSWCPVEIDFTLGLDDFRSIDSGSWQDSWGAFVAMNVIAPLPVDFFLQLGGSYGVYDWAGRASTPYKNSKTTQQQGFTTFAASWQTPCASGVNAGIAYDWVLNKNLGLFAVNPCFDQIRGQIGYLIKGGNELGVWGSYGIRTVHQESREIPLRFKAISQVNLFWCHYFKSHGFMMLWGGVPYQKGLAYSSGAAGRYLLGAQVSVPVTRSLSIEGHAAYMGPRGGSGIEPSKNYAADISLGITYAFGKRKIAKNPYMSLANNSNFIVDTNHNY